ncbi:MAG: hypothetical protein GY716_16285 [bacterium]|nr:hypothetical protein [bacterium]
MKRAAVVLLACVALCAASCSDDPGGGGVFEFTCIDFTPSVTTPDPGTLYAVRGDDSGCNSVFVELWVTGVDDVFGADLDISYDAEVSLFLGGDVTGSLLAAGGAAVQLLEFEEVAGQAKVGVTRLGGMGVNVTDPQLLVTLEFANISPDPGDDLLVIVDNCLVDSGDPEPAPIDGVTCEGGTLSVEVFDEDDL